MLKVVTLVFALWRGTPVASTAALPANTCEGAVGRILALDTACPCPEQCLGGDGSCNRTLSSTSQYCSGTCESVCDPAICGTSNCSSAAMNIYSSPEDMEIGFANCSGHPTLGDYAAYAAEGGYAQLASLFRMQQCGLQYPQPAAGTCLGSVFTGIGWADACNCAEVCVGGAGQCTDSGNATTYCNGTCQAACDPQYCNTDECEGAAVNLLTAMRNGGDQVMMAGFQSCASEDGMLRQFAASYGASPDGLISLQAGAVHRLDQCELEVPLGLEPNVSTCTGAHLALSVYSQECPSPYTEAGFNELLCPYVTSDACAAATSTVLNPALDHGFASCGPTSAYRNYSVAVIRPGVTSSLMQCGVFPLPAYAVSPDPCTASNEMLYQWMNLECSGGAAAFTDPNPMCRTARCQQATTTILGRMDDLTAGFATCPNNTIDAAMLKFFAVNMQARCALGDDPLANVDPSTCEGAVFLFTASDEACGCDETCSAGMECVKTCDAGYCASAMCQAIGAKRVSPELSQGLGTCTGTFQAYANYAAMGPNYVQYMALREMTYNCGNVDLGMALVPASTCAGGVTAVSLLFDSCACPQSCDGTGSCSVDENDPIFCSGTCHQRCDMCDAFQSTVVCPEAGEWVQAAAYDIPTGIQMCEGDPALGPFALHYGDFTGEYLLSMVSPITNQCRAPVMCQSIPAYKAENLYNMGWMLTPCNGNSAAR